MIGNIISFLVLAIIAIVAWHGLKMIFKAGIWALVFVLVVAAIIGYVIWTERK